MPYHLRAQPRRAAWPKVRAAPTPARSGAARASARRVVADPGARARAEAGGPIAGVGKSASIQRQAAATDALGEADLEALELGDPLVDPRCPRAGETRPVAAGRRALRRQLCEVRADLIERQPHPLGEDDERDAPEPRPRVAPVTRAGPFGCDQAPLLVEAQRRCRHAAAPCDLADREQGMHATK